VCVCVCVVWEIASVGAAVTCQRTGQVRESREGARTHRNKLSRNAIHLEMEYGHSAVRIPRPSEPHVEHATGHAIEGYVMFVLEMDTVRVYKSLVEP
jgi:hypothetical protein